VGTVEDVVATTDQDVIRAAGGVLYRITELGPEVAVVHRPRYDDWTLPKGKLLPGEREEDAALREVEEETGYRARLERPLGVARYRDSRGRDKVVRYWVMRGVDGAFQPSREIDEMRWLPVEQAAALLSNDRDRQLLTQAKLGT
jgi:8-oxo-dGTP diphosphatase